MADDILPSVEIQLTSKEAERLKLGIEKCFKMETAFTETEMEGLERTYDVLMGLN